MMLMNVCTRVCACVFCSEQILVLRSRPASAYKVLELEGCATKPFAEGCHETYFMGSLITCHAFSGGWFFSELPRCMGRKHPEQCDVLSPFFCTLSVQCLDCHRCLKYSAELNCFLCSSRAVFIFFAFIQNIISERSRDVLSGSLTVTPNINMNWPILYLSKSLGNFIWLGSSTKDFFFPFVLQYFVTGYIWGMAFWVRTDRLC